MHGKILLLGEFSCGYRGVYLGKLTESHVCQDSASSVRFVSMLIKTERGGREIFD